MPDNPGPCMDELDQQWANAFVGDTRPAIPPGSFIEGFVSVLSWIEPDGTRNWRSYNTIDAPLSNILGLLQMAQFTYLHNNLQPESPESEE